MSRTIDADAFAEFIKHAIKTQKYDFLKVNDTTLTVAEVLECVVAELEGTGIDGFKNNPTIEPRKGKWIYHEPLDVFECSVCGRQMVRNIFNYCPWCGAQMERWSEWLTGK